MTKAERAAERLVSGDKAWHSEFHSMGIHDGLIAMADALGLAFHAYAEKAGLKPAQEVNE